MNQIPGNVAAIVGAAFEEWKRSLHQSLREYVTTHNLDAHRLAFTSGWIGGVNWCRDLVTSSLPSDDYSYRPQSSYKIQLRHRDRLAWYCDNAQSGRGPVLLNGHPIDYMDEGAARALAHYNRKRLAVLPSQVGKPKASNAVSRQTSRDTSTLRRRDNNSKSPLGRKQEPTSGKKKKKSREIDKKRD